MLGALACVVLGITAPAASAQSGLVPCGILSPCPPPPKPPSGQGDTVNGQRHEITAGVSPQQVTIGKSVTISGRYTVDGSGGTSRAVYLIARKFPYDSEVVVAQASTGTAGRYSFRQTPQLNTQYYVRTGDLDPAAGSTRYVTAGPYPVTVYAKIVFFKVRVIRNSVGMKLMIDFPDETSIPLRGRRVNWYIVRGSKKKLVQVGSDRSRETKGRRMIAQGRSHLPRAGRKGFYRFFGAFCVDFPVGVDFGVGTPPKRRCP